MNNYYASLMFKSKWQVTYGRLQNQLTMKCYAKFLVSSICQNIFITGIKKFTIVNVLG